MKIHLIPRKVSSREVYNLVAREARVYQHSRATNSVSPHPQNSLETVKAQFLLSFNIVLGGEEGGVKWFFKGHHCFSQHYL